MDYRLKRRTVLALGLLTATGPALAAKTVDLGHGINADFTAKGIIGGAVRTQSPSNDILFAGNNPRGRSDSAVSDDGDLNYKKGDFVKGSAQLYGNLKLSYSDYGIVVSGYGWEDYIEDEKSVPHGNVPNNYQPNTPLGQTGFDNEAQFNGAVLQEAYAFGKFDLKGHDLTIKVGRQLLIWGRSIYNKASYSSLNAINLPAFHRPGSDYEQYLLPAGMVTGDFDLTKNFNVQAFYQFEWRHATLDPCGTFYDTYDNVSPGCYATLSSNVIQPDQVSLNQGLYFRRTGARNGNNGGQYGAKVQYSFTKADAHLGAYFFNYNARLPIYNVTKNANPGPSATIPIPPFNAVTTYYDYPNDIKVYGLTADKTFQNVGNLALNLSYVENMPIGLNTPALTTQAVTSALGAPSDPRIPAGTQSYINGFPLGSDVKGYKSYGVERAELTFTTIVPNLLGASQTVVSAEAAFENIPDLPPESDIRFGRHTNFGIGNPGADGYVTDFSWGYQVLLESTYENVIGALAIKPNFTLRDGVKGFSSDGALQEHQRTITAGLGFEYNNFGADLSYTNYSTTAFSTVQDRDYVAFSTSYSF